jgi:putative ABC transport system permease protein
MLGLVIATMWRRRTQSVLLLLLAVVASAGAAAAPGYVVASREALAVATVQDASVAERVVLAHAEQPVSPDPAGMLVTFADKVRDRIGLPDAAVVSGATMTGVVNGSIRTLAYRDDVCAHLVIQGACPRAAGELLVAEDLANQDGLRVGDRLAVRGRTEIPPITMTIVGRYRAINPAEAYWGPLADGAERVSDVGVFTTAATFAQLGSNVIGLDVALTVPAETYRNTDPEAMAQRVAAGTLRLTGEGVTVTSGLATVADRYREEQRLVVVGVVIGVGELLVVTWLALFLAIRRTADARRGDIDLLKLRGTRRRDLWRLVAALILFPLIVGGAIGVAVGPWLADHFATPAERNQASFVSGHGVGRDWRLAAAAAGIAILGAAVAAFAAERRTLASSPGSLARRVASGRAGRWTLLLDASVVLLAAGGVYEATVGGAAAVGGIGLLAPVFAALAVGVLATRLVAVLASRVGTRTLRAGRLGPALAALQLARRPGMSSALGVAVVVVATLVTTALAWSTANSAYEQRAVTEIGAPTVLTVRAASPGQLLSAVRRVDPAGRSAMAVARTEAAGGPVLAVDATRLAAVAPYLDSYGTGDWDAVAKTLHPDGFTPAVVRVAQLELDASWLPVGTAGNPSLAARVVGPDGAIDVSFGPVAAGRHTYRAPTPSCTAGCRLVSITLASTVGRPATGSVLTVHSVSGLEPGTLADRGRWRASVSMGAQVPQLTVAADGLSIVLDRGVPAGADGLSVTAYVADAPTPLPVLRAGTMSLGSSEPHSAVLGNDVLPVRLAEQGRSLPEINTGLLADLEYADRLASRLQQPTMQVWLAATAPTGIEADLTAAGITVLSRASIDERRAALDARGSAAALRFMLAVAVVALGLVLLSFAIAAAAELRPWAADLGALRRQGLAGRVVRRAAILGYLAAATAAVGLGLLTGLVLQVTLPTAVPIFADGWSDVDTPGASPVLAAGMAATVAVLFGAVALAAAGALVGRTRHRIGEVPWSD